MIHALITCAELVAFFYASALGLVIVLIGFLMVIEGWMSE